MENYYSFASYFKPKPAHRSFILKNVYLIIVFVFWTVFESFFIKILMYLLNVLTYRTQTNQKNIHWLHCGLIDKIIRHSHLKINLTQVQVLVLVLPQLCILLKMVQNWLLWQEILLKFVYSEKAKKNSKQHPLWIWKNYSSCLILIYNAQKLEVNYSVVSINRL